jgi:hypothetical protein
MRLTTTKELRKIARKFASGELERVMIVGPPGQGKTETIKRALGQKGYLCLRGRTTAMSFYEELHDHCDMPVVLDDTAEMLLDTNVQEMLRDLTETTRTRRVSWRTQSKHLEEKGIPKSFVTRSPVCVLANKLGTGGVWPALNSRCLRWRVEFEWPELVAETRRQGWFSDEEILEYALKFARCQPDLRFFEKAAALKKAKLADWRELFEAEVTEPEKVIQAICSDPDLSTEDKVRRFVAEGHGSRATYFRRVKKLGGVSSETGVAS